MIATDIDNQSVSNSFMITISDVNESPTEITISNNSIGEHVAIGSIIGVLSTTDPDVGDAFTYALSGAVVDNAFFDITGDNLVSSDVFNFENQSIFSIQLTVPVLGSNKFDQPLTISISDANDTPTALNIDNQTIFENLPFGTLIGNLSAVDEDANDVHSYSLIAGTGDMDNASVLISGSQLLLNNSIDFKSKNSLSIRVEVKDGSSATFQTELIIDALNQNEAPIIINPIGKIEKESNSTMNLSVADVFSDVDSEDVLTLSITVAGQSSLPEGIIFDSENAIIQ